MNMSTNSARFEVICFKRYFMLYKYMCMYDVECAMMLDSDVLCYVNCSSPEFIDIIKHKAVAFSVTGKWTGQACGPQFLFITREALKSFIDFCLDMYKNHLEVLQKKYHDEFIVTGLPGGICDMQLLSMWCQTIERDYLLNWSEQDTYLIDHHVNTDEHRRPGQFKKDKLLGIKAIKYIDDLPHFYDIEKKQWVRVHVLHFQGGAKKFMCDFFYRRPYVVPVLHRVYHKVKGVAMKFVPKPLKNKIKKFLGLRVAS